MATRALVSVVAMQAVEKINAQVKAGNHYEAQQMYKTVYHRFHSRKQLPESYQVLQVGCMPARHPLAWMRNPPPRVR